MATGLRAVRGSIALAAALVCLGAVVAYAATRPREHQAGLAGSRTVKVAPSSGPGSGGEAETAGPGREERLPRAHLIEYPEAATTVAEPQFRFHVSPRPQRPRPSPPGPPGEPPPPRRFQCQLDGGDWNACGSPHRLAGLAVGDHSFAVRALTRDGRPGPVATHSWRQEEQLPTQKPAQGDPRPFSIESRAAVEDLYPGYPAQQLPVLIGNPNSVPIEVISLTVAIAAAPPSCAAENFELTPSSVSPAAPLTVPAGGSVGLPSSLASAPSIGMLDLPVNQDACRGTQIPLVFSGEARG